MALNNSRFWRTFPTLLTIALFCKPSLGKVIYVEDNAVGANNGTSWNSAYLCLQDAITNASSGDEIHVAQGTYKPDQEVVMGRNLRIISTGDRAASFQVKNGVTIKGGFAGVDEPNPDARDIHLYKTILSGDLNDDDGPNFRYNSDNSYHVVNGSRTSRTDLLDGFTITAGNANRPPRDNYGGGLYTNDAGNLTIINCTFIGNSASEDGGGIYCVSSSPNIEYCTFSGNSANHYGGGIHCDASLEISNSAFASNSAMYGGAIFCYGSSPIITNCTIVANSASGYGGGGIYCGNATPRVINTILWNNRPDEIYAKQSSINVSYSNVQGGWSGIGNIDTDPLFVNASGIDGIIGTEDDDLHLSPGSPCIDSGDNSSIRVSLVVDLDGNPRITNSTIDIGAYEFGITTTSRIYHVDTDAIGANDGSSWINAYICLQDAIAVAQIGEEIHVAQGIYKPDQETITGRTTRIVSSGDRAATFQMQNGVAIRGGYAGFGEPNPNARDISVYKTILSGDLRDNDGPDFLNYSDNSYHVVTSNGVNETAVLEGFTITAGNAIETPGGYGGGMYNILCSPRVTNCTFTKNMATRGAGMANRGDTGIISGPTLINCSFFGNFAQWGGGMCFWGFSSGTLTNCIFSGNTAEDGGAITITKNSEATLRNCTFTGNRASVGTAGAIECSGDSSLTLFNSILWADIPNEISLLGSLATVTHTNIQGGWPGVGNITVNPLFMDADGADGMIGTEDDDLHLSPRSPCANVGDNSTLPSSVVKDIDGNPRIAHGIVDMGAYELNIASLPNVYYVDADATGTNDGSSWANAYPCLQDALAVARSGNEIFIAQGTYKPDRYLLQSPRGTQISSSGDRAASFILHNGVTIKGGYAGFGESDPDARDIILYETILSGDLNDDDGPEFTNNSENSYHVIISTNNDQTAILDGLIITSGNANGSLEDGTALGAGMYIIGGTPTITDCTFKMNSATFGAGIENENSHPILTNCIFNDNTATYGGGMENIESNPILINCTFRRNSAKYGAGMENSESNPVLTNCIFSSNYAESEGGGIDNYSNCNPVLTNCTFVGNSANIGGSVHNANNSNPTITNCILWNSTPQEIFGGVPLVTYSDIQGDWTGEGNINLDPRFVNIEGVDGVIGTEDDDIRLLQDSPCINAGDNTEIPIYIVTDIDGNIRIINEIVDMGAYEFGTAPIVDETKYGGGTGTAHDPYLIYTAEQMNTIGIQLNDLDKYFKLMADIDLSDYTGDTVNSIYNIIGQDTKPFGGVFDGNGKKIINFSYNSTDRDYVGLFGYVDGAEIKNIGLINLNIDAGARSNIGSLAGYLCNGIVSNCYAKDGNISAGGMTGGLIGVIFRAEISNCYSIVNVSGREKYLGGLAGSNGWGGEGGGAIINCYSAGTVSGRERIGGLVGWNRNRGRITNCFWDTQASRQARSEGGIGKTTAEMQTASTFLEAYWDFVDETANGTEDIWWIDEGNDYPKLWWELMPGN